MFNTKSVCSVKRNPNGPATFTGAYWPWVCITPDGLTYCDTREGARGVAREYNNERRALIAEFERSQGRANFYEANPQ